MAQISIVQKSDIIKAGRFDAEYFKPEYLQDLTVINNHKTKPLSFFIKDGYRVVYENTEVITKNNDTNQKTVNFLQANDINGYFLKDNLSKVKYSDWEKYPKGRIKRGEILIEVKGNIDKIALVPNDYPLNTLVTGSLYKFTPANISGEFLLIWLTCKYGENLKTKLKRNLMVHFIGKDDLYNIPVPIFSNRFQSEIEKIVKTAHAKQAQAKQLYTEAENLLLAELDLLDYQPQHQLTFDTIKKEVDQAGRFDAEYFQPKYANIIKRIENYAGGFGIIKNMVDWKKGIEVGTKAYTENGKDFVRVSDVSINGVEKTNRKISNALFDELKKDFQPKKGDILFTKDGTIGIANVVNENLDGVVSGAFLRLTLRGEYLDFEKECLTLILNSVLCKMQVEKLSGGAIIAHLKPSDFDKFKIPLIKQSIQQQIAQKITQSHQLRTESKDLLELAKLKVEQAIES